jgi:dihydroorotate dehydrogenase
VLTRAMSALAMPLLLRLPPETAHRATIAALKHAPHLPRTPASPRLAVNAFGLAFPNPLGMAAGFDKSAEVASALLALGFGFVEVGTLTPRPQSGNPSPRLFRLRENGAIVNRMGFNNDGYAAAETRLAARTTGGIVGVNFGPNRDAADRIADFVAGVKAFAPYASYFAVNVSSPNTPALRDLQQRAAFDELAARVAEAREAASPRRPLLIKIAPDLDLRGLDDVVEVCRARGLDGIIVANTTTARPASLKHRDAAQAGGLSGRPLFEPSTRMLARAYLRCEGALTLIGAGGVDSAETALAKIEAGATLVQLYTGLVYRGPALIGEILDGLAAAVPEGGDLASRVGARARQWAAAGA